VQSPNYPDATPRQLEEYVLKAYARNHSMRRIADKLGVAYNTIRRTLRQYDVELRQCGKRAKPMDPETTLRRCKSCGRELRLKHFEKNRNSPGGYDYRCVHCGNIMNARPRIVDEDGD